MGNFSTHILTEGTSFLSFIVKNNGTARSQASNAQIEIKASFLTVEESQILSEGIEPNSSLRLTFPVEADGTERLGAWPQIQIKLQHQDTELQIDTILQYGGIYENFETDTLNQVFNWYNTSSYKWEYCDDDTYEGQRSFRCRMPDTYNQTLLRCVPKNGKLVSHTSKISFHYKSNKTGCLRYNSSTQLEKSETWKYVEITVPNRFGASTWTLVSSYSEGDTLTALIDDICFPPTHRPIINAGSDLISCGENAVELLDAYAYDCNSTYWATEGDGGFEDNTLVNTLYLPGNQDFENGEVTLSLYAISNDTLVDTKRIRFVDEIDLGPIVGDSVVNKYTNPVSHYVVEKHEGIRYLWQLEPSNAGSIYGYDNEIDILWNQHENDREATLSVTAENGCITQPTTKHISLINYSTPEWHSVDFDLYPNPTDGKVNLVIGETLQGKAIVEVYNLLGEQMMAKKVSHLQKGETYTLDLSHLVSGLYIIKLSTENGTCSKKVSIK